MDKTQSGHAEQRTVVSTLAALLKEIIKILTGTRPLLEYLVDVLENRVEKMQRRMLVLMVIYFTMFAGIIFIILGIFLMMVDFTGIPRGVVFTAGGLFVLLVSMLVIQSGKNKGRKHE
ncbi:MAG: hypothetical protein PHE88_01400 [Elusimicrobia bacterium]|nr:hypothetical protein [Elusimicrobiota bacterium]